VTRSSNFNWGPASFIIAYHLVLLIALPLYFIHSTPSWQMVTLSAVLMYVTGLSVTAGYHRLYSHKTYKMNPIIEAVFLFFSTMATQGSALRWSFDHRHHHSFVDTDNDPYSIKKGFWYAHFLWLLEKPKEIDMTVVSDLARNPLLRFQHRFYPWLMLLTNAIAFLAAGWYFADYYGAFLFVWLTRLFFLHHFTWFINSLAHTWGARHFCQEHSAVDNYLISLLTFGEGYHNYHHTFAYDYRNGIRWFHFDPTKWLIWTLSKLGLARQLKKVDHEQIHKKILLGKQQLLLERLRTSFHAQQDELEHKIATLIDGVLKKSQEIKEMTLSYQSLKKQKDASQKDRLRALSSQIKELKNSLNEEYRVWNALSRHVMALPASS
jgi:stearoyl-CoA desaturase (delta-9 desaturase)